MTQANEEVGGKKRVAVNFNWVDDEIAEIKCPSCGKDVTVTIYEEDVEKHKCECGKKYLLTQINYVEEIHQSSRRGVK